MSKENLKFKLDSQAFELLRDIIKRETSFSNLTAENITVKKEALTMLKSWLEQVYSLDEQIIIDEGDDIDKLFSYRKEA
jgi:acetylornithine deacetylase/succinyl-diaminopimelate desuccinylase-like protein